MQPDLQKLLDDYRDHNIRPSFDFRPYTEFPMMGINHGGMIEKAVNALKARAEEENKQLYILPINSWYRQICKGNWRQKFLTEAASTFSQ